MERSKILDRLSVTSENLVKNDHRFNLGILTQPAPSDWQKANRTTYLAASYVKYVESTGAQVVPIR